MNMRGQAAVMDALFFMLVCSGAAVLLYNVAAAYNTTTTKQVTALYNYEYAQTAIVALHYAKDSQSAWFWNRLRGDLADRTTAGAHIVAYLEGDGQVVWNKVIASSPAPYAFLCFESDDSQIKFCVPSTAGASAKSENDLNTANRPAYTSAIRVTDTAGTQWAVTLKLYY